MKTFRFILLAFAAGFAGAYTFFRVIPQPQPEPESINFQAANYTSENNTALPDNTLSAAPALAPVDFSDAASRATSSVVFINSISQGMRYSYWDMLFGEGGSRQTQVSSGSGVIFSQDGYIITNNHVVQSAEQIEVMYNKRSYPAELIGTDPSTDLAVIKIDEKNLPAITLGSSRNLQVGEWVIAVGNPFTLSSTVTAGIVSAKGRRIGILEDKFPIESFIQTDAAINPGNSGGALVNKNGELVGINTAILSRTGSYTGYAFAVPVDIAKKVFDDLVKHGIVQKAFFGGNVTDYNYENAKKYKLNTDVKNFNGVLLDELEREGPAAQAGLTLGDVIIKINDAEINSQSSFEEALSYLYPGTKISVTFLHDGKEKNASLTLVNRNGGTDLIKRKIVSSSSLGVQLESTEYGVKIFRMKDNSILKDIGIPENFTIIALNRVRVREPEEVIDFFEKFKGRGSVYGINTSRQQIEIPFVLR